MLDVGDPANPQFLADSTFPDPDPISALEYEGNGHAAVFGGNGDYIFGGDEDFDPTKFALNFYGTIEVGGEESSVFYCDGAQP